MLALRRMRGASLALGLCVTSGVLAMANDAELEVVDDWYPVACSVWRDHMLSRVERMKLEGRLDDIDAASFARGVARVGRDCPNGGRQALRLFLSLDEALTAWPASTGPEPPKM